MKKFMKKKRSGQTIVEYILIVVLVAIAALVVLGLFSDTLRKKISGSIEGDAIQKDMTGGNGTPPINNAAITGITPHEQNGLNAPTSVAKKIAASGRACKARLM